MNEAEKQTLAATLAAYEEVLTTLLSRVLAEAPQEQIDGLNERMRQGPILNPNAPIIHDLDAADRLAGLGQEYGEIVTRIYTQALAVSGRS